MRYPAFLPRLGCLLALGMLTVFVLAVSRLWNAVQPPGKCTHVVLDRLPSPDGAWVAVIDEYTCDVGSFSTAITAELHLITTKPALRDIDLLGVDTGGNDNERPRVAWSVSNVLRVTVPLSDYLRFRNKFVEGVQVDIRFGQDDPMVKEVCRAYEDRLRGQVDDTMKP